MHMESATPSHGSGEGGRAGHGLLLGAYHCVADAALPPYASPDPIDMPIQPPENWDPIIPDPGRPRILPTGAPAPGQPLGPSFDHVTGFLKQETLLPGVANWIVLAGIAAGLFFFRGRR